MAETISITKQQRGGNYADILDFLATISGNFGSATNAAAMLIRSTPEYKSWQRRLKGSPRRKAG